MGSGQCDPDVVSVFHRKWGGERCVSEGRVYILGVNIRFLMVLSCGFYLNISGSSEPSALLQFELSINLKC